MSNIFVEQILTSYYFNASFNYRKIRYCLNIEPIRYSETCCFYSKVCLFDLETKFRATDAFLV